MIPLVRAAALALVLSAGAAPLRAHAQDSAAATGEASTDDTPSREAPTDEGAPSPEAGDAAGTPSDTGEPGAGATEAAAPERALDFDVASSDEALPSFGATARVDVEPTGPDARASSTVTRDEMDERLSRSAPDALRWLPGVSVQETTHGQASPYVRGLTGQQVLLAFDGIRLNNGVYRQGPNQYFFTVDSATLDHIEVLRGSASTRWGSDALGGAVLAAPAEPTLDPRREGLSVGGRAIGRFGTQDLDAGGRLELEAQLGRDVAVLVGGGYRAAQELQGAGVLTNPANDRPVLVPLIAEDGRTQRGTGFRYATFDGRLVVRVAPELRLVAAVYGFRQYDTPRADQCPPPAANERECTVFVEQFRTMAYASLRGRAGPELREVDLTVSYQRQHELRELRQPSIYSRNDFRDDVDTVGLSLRLGSRRFTPVAGVGARLRGGGEVYFDLVRSNAFFHNLLVGTIRQLPRGLYADGARYYTGGVFAELDVDLFRTVRLRSAVRLGLAGARSEAEPMSATQRVHSDFAAPVGRVGLEWLLVPELSLIANVDQGFRAPNLDDLTSRQVIGPGFQLENASLRAERSTTFEVGARARGGGLALDAWLFATEIDDAITRAPRSLSECPRDAPECQGAFARFQLVNLDEPAWLLGGEVALRAAFPFGLGVTANVSYAWGEGPSPVPLAEGQRVPLSRVPPVHGTVEVRYANEETRLVVGAAMRWAGPQDRLSISDGSDARIPIGGTPAYAVFDLRAGWRFEDTVRLQLSVVFENVFDQVYRVHGSGINGAGRGLLVQLEGAL